MPELPEVECWGRRVAERACAGKVIVDVKARPDAIVFDGVSAEVFAHALKGRRVEACHRRGKQMWWQLDGKGPHPLMHFGMTGHFHVWATPGSKAAKIPLEPARAGRHNGRKLKEDATASSKTSEGDHGGDSGGTSGGGGPPPLTWTKFDVTMDDGTHLAMTDKRRFARITLRDDPLGEPPLANLGPDAWLELPKVAWWMDKLARRRTPIKAVLLDQGFLAGIGNWIADEVLYQAGIDPHRLANALAPAEVKRVRAKTKHVLDKAVGWEADYTKFSRSWLFHQRWELRQSRSGDVLDAAGRKIAFSKVGGRTTSWVPAVQR